MGHLKDSNPTPSVVHTYAYSLSPQLCLHLRALITQSSVFIKLEYAIIYCNKIFKTRATAQILLQHLYDMLWLVNKTGNAHITKHWGVFHNHCLCGQALVFNIMSVCLNLDIPHVNNIFSVSYYIVICGPPDSTILLHIS